MAPSESTPVRGFTGILPKALCLALALWATVLLLPGFYRLTVSTSYPFAHDLSLRWNEHRALSQGVNPGQLNATANYPPWSYGLGLLLAPPLAGWRIVRVWFAALNLMALVGIALWGWRQGLGERQTMPARDGAGSAEPDRWRGGLLAAMLLSPMAHPYALSGGQYSILVAGFCLLSLLSLERRRDWTAGVCLAMAFLKPHVSMFLVLPVLATRRWKTLTALALTLGVFSACPWILAGVDPLQGLLQARRNAPQFIPQSHGLVGLLYASGLSPRAAAALPLMAGVLIGVPMVWRFRRRPMRELFAVSVTLGLVAAYHKAYDYPLFVFLVAALFVRTASRRRDGSGKAGPPRGSGARPVLALVLLQLALIIPLRMRDHGLWPVALAELAIWLLALRALSGPSGPSSAAPPDGLRER